MGKNETTFRDQQLIEAALSIQCLHEFDELARSMCLEAIAVFQSEQVFLINVVPNTMIRKPQALAQNLQQALAWGLRPQQIIRELTEVEALLDSPKLTQLGAQMRTQGFGVAAVCSNVGFDRYLRELQPALIKLDRHLAHGCSQRKHQLVFIKNLLHSAHELGILVLLKG